MAWTFYDNNGTLLQGVADNSVTSAKIVDGTIVTADLGNITEIDSTSTITLDATTDIVLDAGGADILLKDGGTTFGSFNQTGGELRILSGSTPTLAMTFAGANATLAGNLTVNGTQTTIASTSLTVTDTLIKLNQGYVGTAYDVGIVFTRGNDSATDTANRGFIWDATASEFSTIFCNTESGATAGNVTINDYANIHVGALIVDDTTSVRGVAYTWPASDAAGALTSDGS